MTESGLQHHPGGALVHASALVEPGAILGSETRVWHFCHVLPGARIGARCMLGQGCYVGARVVIGDGVRVQNNVSLYDGVELEDDVFVGPSAVFTNVTRPRAFLSKKSEFRRTLVGRGASIGANATILPGLSIGPYAFVAAGAVVTRDVPAYALVLGAPARFSHWISRFAERLTFVEGSAVCPASGERYRLEEGRVLPEGDAQGSH